MYESSWIPVFVQFKISSIELVQQIYVCNVKGFSQLIKLLKIAAIATCMLLSTNSLADTRLRDQVSSEKSEKIKKTVTFRRKVTKKGQWQSDPSIIICGGAPITEERVRSAMAWWESRGYKFGPLIVKESNHPCHQSGMTGFITIEPASSSFDYEYLAITHVKTHKDEILSAKIVIRGRSEKERIIEHELGHSLGWSHFNRRNHIMNPNWEDGGWSDTGLHLNGD